MRIYKWDACFGLAKCFEVGLSVRLYGSLSVVVERLTMMMASKQIARPATGIRPKL